MTRRILTVACALLILLGLVASPAAAAPKREDLSARVVVLSQEVGTTFLTGNGRWVQHRDISTTLAGTATVGTTDYAVDVDAEGTAKTSPDGSVGWGHVWFTNTWAPLVGGGDEFVCTGVLHSKRVSVPPPFSFAEEGFARATCDNGMKWKADVYGQFEIDPIVGPTFVFYFTGEAR